jgi:hypothetical protein
MDQAEVQAEMPEVLALAGAGQGFETFAAAVGARQQIEVAMRKVMAHRSSGLAHWGVAASFRSSELAAERGRQAIELARRHGWSGEPVVAIAYPMLAGSLIWQGELDEAERWLMEGGYAPGACPDGRSVQRTH